MTGEITYLEAIRAAIAEAMREDERVFLLGEDIGHFGGPFGVTKGLLEEFGDERLIDTPQIRAGIWVYFVEHAPDTVFRAGRQAAEPIMSLKVYALKGGFNAETKTRMVVEATAILGKYSKTDGGQVPAYVGILEVPEENWGMYGQQVHLAAMQIKT